MSPNILRGVATLGLSGLVAAAAFVLLGLVAAPRTLAGDPCYHGFVIPPRSEAAETQIKVAPCAFAPTVAHVAVGATVTFFNGPDVTHLVTGANAEWGSRDVELKPGQTVSYRFDTPGIYPYACALHRGMSGTIVVGDAIGAAAAATTEPSQAPPAAQIADEPPSGTTPTVVAGTGLGILVGAAGLWIATRLARRRPKDDRRAD